MSETDVSLSTLPDGWVWTKVRSVIEKVPIGKKKLKQKNYESVGKFPVIDQGLSFIGGYTNHEELKVECQLPIVVFGDHTKVFKYVDFDFVAGADGIKVIRPQEMYHPKLFYYFARAISLPDKGYARHFQFLEKAPIPLPPLPEQHRIVAKIEELFTKLDAGINELHKAQSQLKQYRQSVLKAAFGGKLTEAWRTEYQEELEPASVLLERILKERREKWEAEQLGQMKAKGEMPKDHRWKAKYKEPIVPDTSNLPELPKGWLWTTLPQIGELNRGKSRHRPRNAPLLYGGQYPLVQTGDIRHANGLIRHYNLTYSEEGLKQSRLWTAGTLCITIAANIADTAILGFDACFPDSIVGFLPEYGQCNIYFVEFFLRTAKADLERYAPATAQKNINLAILKDLAIPFPPLAEQNVIAQEIDRHLSVADEVEKTITVELKRAEQLRQSILKKAFSGELVPQDPNDEPASVLLERIKAEKSQHIQGQLRLKLA